MFGLGKGKVLVRLLRGVDVYDIAERWIRGFRVDMLSWKGW